MGPLVLLTLRASSVWGPLVNIHRSETKMPIPRDLSIPSWHGTLWDEFCTDCPSVLSNDFRKLIMGSSIKDGCRRRTTFASEADSGGISGLGSKEHCVYSIASIWSVVAPHFSNNGIIFVWPTWDISHNSAKHTLRLKSCFCASLPITLKSKKGNSVVLVVPWAGSYVSRVLSIVVWSGRMKSFTLQSWKLETPLFFWPPNAFNRSSHPSGHKEAAPPRVYSMSHLPLLCRFKQQALLCQNPVPWGRFSDSWWYQASSQNKEDHSSFPKEEI